MLVARLHIIGQGKIKKLTESHREVMMHSNKKDLASCGTQKAWIYLRDGRNVGTIVLV
jgi:hypothetical protein